MVVDIKQLISQHLGHAMEKQVSLGMESIPTHEGVIGAIRPVFWTNLMNRERFIGLIKKVVCLG